MKSDLGFRSSERRRGCQSAVGSCERDEPRQGRGIGSSTVWMRTQSGEFKIDVSDVDPDELKSMCKVLALMNFDDRLQLSGI